MKTLFPFRVILAFLREPEWMTTGDALWKLREPRVVVTANIPDNTDVDYAEPSHRLDREEVQSRRLRPSAP